MNEPTYPIAYTSEPGVVLMKATKPAPASGGAIEPNPQRTHVGQARVRSISAQARLSHMRVGEKEIFTADFTRQLAPGETIKTPAWMIAVADGKDLDADKMRIGDPSIAGAMVSQVIEARVPGIRYTFKCVVQTSLGQTLILPEYGDSFIDITL